MMRMYPDHDRQPDFISQVPSSRPTHAGVTTPISSANPTLNAVLPLRPFSPGVVERGNPSQMDLDGTSSNEDRTRRDTSVLSMDDIEAAQALEGLRSGMTLI